MDITQLLIDAALLIGMLLMTALAVVPLWLRHDAERAQEAPHRARPADPAAPVAPAPIGPGRPVARAA